MSPDNPFQDMYHEVAAKDWSHAKDLLTTGTSSNWAFRGHRDSSWFLATSLDCVVRWKPEEAPEAYSAGRIWIDPGLVEDRTLERFKRLAHHYLSPQLIPADGDDFAWLALMQHYGAPTRLLDWTESPYVALYFALEEPTKSCAVWAIDRYWFHTTAAELIRDETRETITLPERYDFFTKKQFHRLFRSNKFAFVAGAAPFKLHERLNIQQGIFIIPGDVRVSFMENLDAHNSEGELRKHLKKIVVSGTVRAQALRELNQMNINRATLFPGLDGFAQSLVHDPILYTEYARRM